MSSAPVGRPLDAGIIDGVRYHLDHARHGVQLVVNEPDELVDGEKEALLHVIGLLDTAQALLHGDRLNTLTLGDATPDDEEQDQ